MWQVQHLHNRLIISVQAESYMTVTQKMYVCD